MSKERGLLYPTQGEESGQFTTSDDALYIVKNGTFHKAQPKVSERLTSKQRRDARRLAKAVLSK